MLLRSITKHVRDQNWFAVFLDFFIVVAGILIAFQITEWNETQKDRLAEKEYLARLVADTTASIDLISTRHKDLIRWANDVEALVAGLEAKDEARIAAHETAMISASRVSRPAPQFAAVTELISSGNINIIRNAEIRNAIAEAENFAGLRDSRVGSLSNMQKALVPNIRTRFRLIPIPVETDGPLQYQYKYDFDALTKDDEFINALSQSAHHLRINALWMKDVEQEMRDLRSLITEIYPSTMIKDTP